MQKMKTQAKLPYEPPRIEVFFVESQGVLCSSAFEGEAPSTSTEAFLETSALTFP